MPTLMARVKASATRPNVTPILKNNAPDAASDITTCMTAGGAGSFMLPASSAAIHQVARKIAKDNRRSTSISGECMIERARIEFRSGSHEVATADAGQHAIEHTRVLFLFLDPTARNAFAIPIAIGPQGRGIRSARQLGDLVPRAIRR